MCGIKFSGGGSAYINEKDKTLYIKGTGNRDEINITQANDFIRVSINKNTEDFSSSNVEKVDVKALGGDDFVKFEDKRSGSGLKNLSLNIDGGDGDDIIYAGDGDDTIYGGKGNDEIYGEGGNNIIYGGDGDDFLIGSFSHPENSKLTGGPGNDHTYKDGIKPID